LALGELIKSNTLFIIKNGTSKQAISQIKANSFTPIYLFFSSLSTRPEPKEAKPSQT
jgi:hypothetical protein